MATAKKKVVKKTSKKPKSSASSKKTASSPKKENNPEPTAAERTEAFIQKMKASPAYRGKIQVRSARNYRTPYRLRRPTGVAGIDLRALRGGFPAGGASQIYGPKGTGKTHLALRTAGEVQKNYGNDSIIALGASEGRVDVGFARSAGFCMAYGAAEIEELDNIRFHSGLPRFTDEEIEDLQMQIGEVIFLGGSTGGDLLQSTIEVLEEFGSACQLIIVDSLGSLLTPDQDTGKVADRHYGGSSGIITTWQTKVQPLYVNDRPDGSVLETTILGINQVRALIGAPKPNMTRPAAGAKSWEHAQLNSIELKRGEPLWNARRTEQRGHEVRWSLKKGKAGTHDGITGQYDWRHILDKDPIFWKDIQDKGKSYAIDVVADLVETAKHYGVLEIKGKWYYYRDAETGDVIARGDGSDDFANKVELDPELEAKIREDCIDRAGLTVRYR
jgi:RecA/RadA recombinase